MATTRFLQEADAEDQQHDSGRINLPFILCCAATLLLFMTVLVMLVCGTPPSSEGGEESPSTNSPKKRELDEIQRVLIIETWSNGNNDSKSSVVSSDNQVSQDECEDIENQEQNNGKDDSNHECAICLGSLAKGETVCRSSNQECCHIFHLNCANVWLQNHDDCPLCRQSYFTDEDEVSSLEDGDS